mmetsp:Transcript_3184/g.9284  ORF Transcript_3184/g.9284 Transcript_3184/m.9284 type:complete len:241 (+) Transcript_3184:441-1163(+)
MVRCTTRIELVLGGAEDTNVGNGHEQHLDTDKKVLYGCRESVATVLGVINRKHVDPTHDCQDHALPPAEENHKLDAHKFRQRRKRSQGILGRHEEKYEIVQRQAHRHVFDERKVHIRLCEVDLPLGVPTRGTENQGEEGTKRLYYHKLENVELAFHDELDGTCPQIDRLAPLEWRRVVQDLLLLQNAFHPGGVHRFGIHLAYIRNAQRKEHVHHIPLVTVPDHVKDHGITREPHGQPGTH